ncbi:MAG: hypothetical protein KatS3mg024_1134 [Armatimonadota bacterium]|nr:MAG: hypothetical protein KatS3mg024_1134 [Armatimonadota bacterium]
MRLEDIQLEGAGAFLPGEACFAVRRFHLEEPWPWILCTEKILLRLDQRGPDYLQLDPPAGTVLFKRESHQPYSSLVVWIRPRDWSAFPNFWAPGPSSGREPESFEAVYSPDAALYTVRDSGLVCRTELCVHPGMPALLMSVEVENVSGSAVEFLLLPALRPHFAAFSLAPWDVPALYQRIGYSNEAAQTFDLELRSPGGIPTQRHYALVLTDLDLPEAVWLNYSRFIGTGTFEMPAALTSPVPPDVDCSKSFPFGHYDPSNSINGCQGGIALSKRVKLDSGRKTSFRMVILGTGNRQPDHQALDTAVRLLEPSAIRDARSAHCSALTVLSEKRSITTPDECLNRYVNEFLPLQLKWVILLDRGWPTGLRGVRDCAQDTAALIPLDPSLSRHRILELFRVQRNDGWFPRQYAVGGDASRHDLRQYVDGGVWVWELLYDYLCCTRDFAILQEEPPWLDDACPAPLLEHVRRTVAYYTAAENLGEHGLCLIREGDWNDSVNRAGLEGRGESVMVTCQVVLMLRQWADLLDRLPRLAPKVLQSGAINAEDAEDARKAARILEEALRTHALNEEGYLNGVFTDRGEWVFSPQDPDGARRVNVPVNSFGIICGLLKGREAERVLSVIRSLKGPDGFPLFHPPIGYPPIAGLGRIGAGDLAPGLGENGTVYNHGCHGFLGRAAAVAGEADLLYEILRYMLPYDQDCHPVRRSKTAPYAVVNHWMDAPGLEGRGGAAFLSGSISTALRNVYSGLLGIRPCPEGCSIVPCLPSSWQRMTARFQYLGCKAELRVRRCGSGEQPAILVGGEMVTEKWTDPVTEEVFPLVPAVTFEKAREILIEAAVP